LPNRWAAPFKA